MAKKYFLFSVFLILLLFSASNIALAGGQNQGCGNSGIVRCGNVATCPCDLVDFFSMLGRIYNFIVWTIATPLAVLMIMIGGALWMLSGAAPALHNRAKEILLFTTWGIILVYGSWLIINTILTILGYLGGTWWRL